MHANRSLKNFFFFISLLCFVAHNGYLGVAIINYYFPCQGHFLFFHFQDILPAKEYIDKRKRKVKRDLQEKMALK